jgi:hypothetical protein
MTPITILHEADLWGLFVGNLDRFSDDFTSFKRDQGACQRRDVAKVIQWGKPHLNEF